VIDFCFSILGEEILLPIYVVGAGYTDEQEQVVREDGFPHFQMMFCLQGEGVLKIDGKEHTIRKSHGFFLLPNTPHEYFNTTEKWKINWIVFDGSDAKKLSETLGFYKSSVFKIRDFSKIQDIFHKAFDMIKENNYYGGFRCSVMLYDFLIEMNLQKNNCCALNEEVKTNYLAPVLAFIEEHFNQDLTLEQLSAIVDFTPQYICRLFKDSLNLRPFEYIARIRVQHAKDMLLHSDMSISEIAATVGYSESSYFCAVFKRYERISPAEFRAVYIAR
jgi:AraC-like DNA-binding protein